MNFKWYNKNAPKNTITRYLSQKYTLAELNNLTHLELPDQFESLDYFNELTDILKNSPWKASEVKYIASSWKSLKGIFAQDYWFGKKTDDNVSVKSSVTNEEGDNNSVKDLGSVYFDPETNLVKSKDIVTFEYHFRLNADGVIVLWKETGEKLQEEPYQNCFFEVNKTYRNCWVTAKTVQPLPNKLPEGVNCLFELVKTKKELNKKNDWDYCLVTEVQPIIDSDSEIDESDMELELKGTYRYEFTTDKQGLISAWRTPSGWWRTKENNIYSNYYLAPNISKYANSYCKIKTLEPLPLTLNLSAQKCLFSPILTEKDFYSQEKNNWTNCYIWEQKPLEYCAKCSEPLFTNKTVKYCANSCQIEKATNQTNNYWKENNHWLLIAGLIVLGVVIIITNH